MKRHFLFLYAMLAVILFATACGRLIGKSESPSLSIQGPVQVDAGESVVLTAQTVGAVKGSDQNLITWSVESGTITPNRGAQVTYTAPAHATTAVITATLDIDTIG